MKINFQKAGRSSMQYLGSAQAEQARKAETAAELYFILTPLQRGAVRSELVIALSGRSSLERQTNLLKDLQQIKATLIY